MRRSHPVALLPCVALLACATATLVEPAGPPPVWNLASASMATGNDLKGAGSRGPISESVQGRSIIGARINLSVAGGRLRGEGNTEEGIDISISGDKAEGMVGEIPFSAIIAMEPAGGARVTGSMGGSNNDFTITPQAIKGRIGSATYNLNWNPERQRSLP
ncbi:MAG: hypothetical protein ACLPJH_09515 [Myxococcaceae bacterium]